MCRLSVDIRESFWATRWGTRARVIWFDFCVRGDASTSSLDCRIQSHEAWLDLEAGARKEGARLRGTFEARREAWVKADENGALAGTIEMVICDAAKLAGLKLVPDD